MEKDHHHTAPAPDAQRIWKVTDTLDQLDMMCEQHHLQTKHIEGQPDWAVHKSAAGVTLPPRQDVPPNFAWHDDEKEANPTNPMAQAALTRKDADLDERVALESRALPLTDELPLQAMTPDDRSIDSINALDQSLSNHFETSAANRKRKVQFADHARGYRDEPSTAGMADLEGCKMLPAVTAHYPPDTRSTYQETYQWPSQEENVTATIHGGRMPAGIEPRDEPHGVYSGNETVVIARKPASDGLANNAGDRSGSSHEYGETSTPALNEPPACIPGTSPTATAGTFIDESTQTQMAPPVKAPIALKPRQPATASTSAAGSAGRMEHGGWLESKDSPW